MCKGCDLRCCLGRAESTQVDHIRPIRDGGTHARPNLRGMCAHCHGVKTSRETKARRSGRPRRLASDG